MATCSQCDSYVPDIPGKFVGGRNLTPLWTTPYTDVRDGTEALRSGAGSGDRYYRYRVCGDCAVKIAQEIAHARTCPRIRIVGEWRGQVRCDKPLPVTARADAVYCSNACRQADYRRSKK